MRIHNCNPPLLKCDTEYVGQCCIIRAGASVASLMLDVVRGGGRFRLVISSLAQATVTAAPLYSITT